jgi:hypothetical protein
VTTTKTEKRMAKAVTDASGSSSQRLPGRRVVE